MTATLTVSEVFGPTMQGEGPYMGQRCGFIRLGLCNLSCSWCDTPYTWDKTRFDLDVELSEDDVEGILATVLAWQVPFVVITGGEPLIQQGRDGWKNLLIGLRRHDIGIHVETNGTIKPNDVTGALVDHFSVSPKLAHAGDRSAIRNKEQAMTAFTGHAARREAIFKFVCQTEDDLDEVGVIVAQYRIPKGAVWIMPEGAEPSDHLHTLIDIADAVIARGWNLTTRLHLLAWGNVRAV